ncbi:MAG: FAD:protein FMN transferase [Sedimentisphaerales bacterium]
MKNSSRRVAIKIAVTGVLLVGVYFFVAEKIRQPVEIDGGYREVMGTLARIVAVAKHQWQGKRCIEAGFEQLKRIDAMMSDYKNDSELSRVNREAFTNPVKVSPELFEILQKSVEFSRLSNGAFDITVGPLVDLWHKAGKANAVPDENTLAAAKARVGFEKLILDANERTVRFAVKGMRLDLGGIAKGYAVDKAIEAMRREGAIGGMVCASGDIRCFGKPADKDTWLVGLQNPVAAQPGADPPNSNGAIGAEQVLMVLKLNDMAVATSGDYRRFVTIDGKRYSHIIDTSTATGASKLSSDTILATTAVDADALSTAVNVMGTEKGLALVESLDGVEAILITAGPEYQVVKSSRANTYLR